MTARDDARFVGYAAPEAIAVELRKATAARNRLDRRVRWLTELQASRAIQIAEGAWPVAAPTEEDGDA